MAGLTPVTLVFACIPAFLCIIIYSYLADVNLARQQTIGIDLGTTNSVLAIKLLQDGRVDFVKNKDTGSLLTPSVVAFYKDGSFLVGQPAEAKGMGATTLVRNSKRQIGRTLEDEITWCPIDVGSKIISVLRESFVIQFGYTPAYVVIAVPVDFDSPQREATVKAVEATGFKVKRVIDEPTAAALAYNSQRTTDLQESEASHMIILIFDMGGGTTDVSALQMHKKTRSISHLGGMGNNNLGGEDFTNGIAQHLENVCDSPGIRSDQRDRRRRDQAEALKIQLTTQSTATFVCDPKDPTIRTYSRAQFEKVAQPIVQTGEALLREVVQSLTLSLDVIDQVILVGGATRIPAVRQMLDTLFGSGVVRADIDPDLTVAYGAAQMDD